MNLSQLRVYRSYLLLPRGIIRGPRLQHIEFFANGIESFLLVFRQCARQIFFDKPLVLLSERPLRFLALILLDPTFDQL